MPEPSNMPASGPDEKTEVLPETAVQLVEMERLKSQLLAAEERAKTHWDQYMRAYEDMIQHTATPDAPWHVVPADHKWFTRLVVAATVVDALSGLDLKFPTVDLAKRRELDAVRRALKRERA